VKLQGILHSFILQFQLIVSNLPIGKLSGSSLGFPLVRRVYMLHPLYILIPEIIQNQDWLEINIYRVTWTEFANCVTYSNNPHYTKIPKTHLMPDDTWSWMTLLQWKTNNFGALFFVLWSPMKNWSPHDNCGTHVHKDSIVSTIGLCWRLNPFRIKGKTIYSCSDGLNKGLKS
jgi:hypothetical protein